MSGEMLWWSLVAVIVASCGDEVFLKVFLFLALGSLFSLIVAYFFYFLLFSFFIPSKTLWFKTN
jgi:hypothetical protein